MSPPSVLVTGARGFIGRRLVATLAERGHEVVAVDLAAGPDADEAPVPDGVRAVVGDVTEPRAWASHLDGIDVVVHSAGIHRADETAGSPELTEAVNVGGTLSVLEAAVERGVTRFVLLSTSKVYGEVGPGGAHEDDETAPLELYARSKVVAEAACLAAHEAGDVDVAVVRPFSVFGPGQDVRTGYVGALLVAAADGAPASLSGTPTTTRDFVHVDLVVDLLAAIVDADRLDHRIWNAGSGRPTALATLAEVFAAANGSPVEVRYRTPNPGTLERSHADMTRSFGLLGRRVPSLLDELRDTLAGRTSP